MRRFTASGHDPMCVIIRNCGESSTMGPRNRDGTNKRDADEQRGREHFNGAEQWNAFRRRSINSAPQISPTFAGPERRLLVRALRRDVSYRLLRFERRWRAAPSKLAEQSRLLGS